VQYSKRCPLFRATFASERSSASIASHLTARSLHAHSSLGHGHGRARLRSRARSSFQKIERRVTARHLSVNSSSRSRSSIDSRSSRGRVAVSRIGASLARRFLIDPQSFAFPGSFRIPEPLVSAFASRRPRPVAVLPLRGARARLVHARLSAITIAPVRSPARWSRSRTVFLFSPFGAESPLCVHSRFGVRPSCSCSLTLR